MKDGDIWVDHNGDVCIQSGPQVINASAGGAFAQGTVPFGPRPESIQIEDWTYVYYEGLRHKCGRTVSGLGCIHCKAVVPEEVQRMMQAKFLADKVEL